MQTQLSLLSLSIHKSITSFSSLQNSSKIVSSPTLVRRRSCSSKKDSTFLGRNVIYDSILAIEALVYRLVFNGNCDKILHLFTPILSVQCNSKSVSFICLKSSLFVEETFTFPYHYSSLKSVKISIFYNFSKYDKISEIFK